LRFTVLTFDTHPEEFDIMEIGADGKELHRLPIHGCCGTWSADGQYYFYQKNRDVWVLPERRSIIRGIELGTPVQLTAGPITFGAPTPGADAKQLFVAGNQPRIELVHYESKSNQLVPFLGGISAGELEVSPDGQWVAYTTYPDSTLWRSKLDGSGRLQLTFAPINGHEPRWSPDEVSWSASFSGFDAGDLIAARACDKRFLLPNSANAGLTTERSRSHRERESSRSDRESRRSASRW